MSKVIKRYAFHEGCTAIISPELFGDKRVLLGTNITWRALETELSRCDSTEAFIRTIERIQRNQGTSASCTICSDRFVPKHVIQVSSLKEKLEHEPYKYLVSKETKEVSRAATITSMESITTDEAEAFKLLREGRNTLRRFKRRCGLYSEYWDAANGTWRSYKKTTEPIRLV